MNYVPRSEEILREHAREMLREGSTVGSGPITMWELVEMAEMVRDEPCMACGEMDTMLIPHEGSFLCKRCLYGA